jgi:ribulose bisphosphate carboxylase small subunit
MSKDGFLKKIDFIDELPADVRIKRGLDEDTIKMIDAVKKSKGKIVALEFENDKARRNAYWRLLQARKKEVISFKRMHRKANMLYVVT